MMASPSSHALEELQDTRLLPSEDHNDDGAQSDTADDSNINKDLVFEELGTYDSVTATITRRLYVSHLLSTFNSRLFEFGAVLYLARIFPGTLLPLSIYAVSRGLAAVLCAPTIGRYIDNEARLHVVRLSIGEFLSRQGD